MYSSINEEIDEVKMMCTTNFGSYWELAHLPYSGGFYEQPADLMENILQIINHMNSAISNKKEKEK